MTQIALGVAMFTGVILALVAMLLVARRQLVASGDVSIVINDDSDKTITAPAGGTLLGALAANGIYLPSACGGRGSCGACDVVVHAGGGDLLPTETSFISPGEARHGHRLACQVKLRRNLRIGLPAAVFSIAKWRCRVLGNRNVATFIKELRLALPEGEDVPFRAGGYVQVECPPHELSFRTMDIDEPFRDDWDKFDLWRFRSVVDEPVTRAYSMASYPLEKGVLIFNVRIAFPPGYGEDIPPGKMSSWLFNLKPGDEVTVSGPYGEFFARDTQAEMCFIGGGAGMAPMRSHIFDQLLRLHSRRKITFWYGARSLREAFYIEEFERLQAQHPNFEWHLALSEPLPEDKWTGPTGFIHKVLRDQYLQNHAAPEEVEYYLCGPPAMTQAVIGMLLDLGVERENILFDEFG